jgi:hypothetical protein
MCAIHFTDCLSRPRESRDWTRAQALGAVGHPEPGVPSMAGANRDIVSALAMLGRWRMRLHVTVLAVALLSGLAACVAEAPVRGRDRERERTGSRALRHVIHLQATPACKLPFRKPRHRVAGARTDTLGKERGAAHETAARPRNEVAFGICGLLNFLFSVDSCSK